MAIGYNKARGDAIAVYSIEQFAGKANAAQLAMTETDSDGIGDANQEAVAPEHRPGYALQLPDDARLGLMAGVATLLLMLLVLAARRNAARPATPPLKQLNDKERETLLANVEAWVGVPAAESKSGAAPHLRCMVWAKVTDIGCSSSFAARTVRACRSSFRNCKGSAFRRIHPCSPTPKSVCPSRQRRLRTEFARRSRRACTRFSRASPPG